MHKSRNSPDYPLQPLENQITELWGHINAATYRFLVLVAEYDAAVGWGIHGCADCAQWLNWQCGIGKVAAREKVRVARALGALPQISASFEKGEVSYSKVRAMTRIATPENEPILLNIARHGTAAHVERIVRQYRYVERMEDARLANETHKHRYFHFRHDDDGSVLIEARLPAEVGAMLKKAIEAAEEVLYRTEREAVEDVSAESRDPKAVVIASDATDPVSAETRDASADEQPANPVSARRADALGLLAERFLSTETENSGSSDRFLVTVHINRAELTDDAETTTGPGPSLPVATARRLGCDGPLVGIVEDDEGNPLNVGRRTRAIPPSMKRALASRDGGCRFPSCNRSRFTEGHHIHHWADGGETRLSNLITLCRFHHRLLHEGGFGLRVTDDSLFVFSRPDGSRIADAGCFRGNSARAPQRGHQLTDLNAREGLKIDAHTIRSRWTGETMDSSLAINAMMHVRERPHYLDDTRNRD
ncbi:MAG TPA: DUF222 domain-containing protein [Gammaproteobacteria bacterium]